MKQKFRLALAALVVVLVCATFLTWREYRKIRRHNLILRRSLVAAQEVQEVRRDYVKLSNYSSDVIYQPKLPNSERYRLIVVSLSAASYYKRRSAVRSTWYKRLKSWNRNYEHKIIHYFICFSPKKKIVKEELLLEAAQYQDIVIFADRDKYSQLPVQTITALDWTNSQFEFDFVLKTDDDALVNVDTVLQQLEGQGTDVFAGRVYKHRKPGNEAEKAWVAKYHPGNDQEFRDFAPGAGYILGVDALRPMLSYSHHVQLTAAEDVYMGEVIGQMSYSITPISGIFPIWQEFCQKSDLANPHWSIIHWLDPERMVRFWERLDAGLGGCQKQDQRRANQQAKQGAFSRN